MPAPSRHQLTRPGAKPAAAHALETRSHLGLAPEEPIDIDELVADKGWSLRSAELLIGGRGLQAGLSPDPRHGFTIAVDQQLLTSEAWEAAFVGHALASEARVRFRIAHEIGHTFFYRQSQPGGSGLSRKSPPNEAEEAFCDEFAAHLLIGADPASRFTGDVAEVIALARRAKAPVGVALDRLGVPAVAGVVEPQGDRPSVISIMSAHDLDDSWVLWRRRPELKTRLITEQLVAGTTVGFIAVCPSHTRISVAVAPWTPEAETARYGYRLDHDGDTQHSMGPAA